MATGPVSPPPPSLTNAQKLALTLVPVAQQTGAIKVSGGTQDGIYSILNNPIYPTFNGKKIFQLLGVTDGGPEGPGHIAWSSNIHDDYGTGPSSSGFIITDADAALFYYSLSDVATPDLVVATPPVFVVDFNNLDDGSAYGTVSPLSSALISLDSGGPGLNSTTVDFTAVSGVFLSVKTGDGPTKQQIINKLVSLGGGKIVDLGGLIIRVSPANQALLPIDFTGMTGSSITTQPGGWFNASDNSPAAITVALATSSDMIDVGQQVAVSDGFVVSGAQVAIEAQTNGFYAPNGTTQNGHPVYQNDNGRIFYFVEGRGWVIDIASNLGYIDVASQTTSAGSGPWDSNWTNQSGLTLTHPAIQQLAAPSDSFVVSGAGSDINGRFYNSGQKISGQIVYVKLGGSVDNSLSICTWDAGGSHWKFYDSNGDSAGAGEQALPAPWLDDSFGLTLTPSPNADPTVVVVSGASNDTYNGLYLSSGTSAGRTRFANAGAFIVWSGAAWVISDTDTYDADSEIYTGADGAANPWLESSWASISGNASGTPTVTAQIQYPALFVANAGTAEADGIYTERGLSTGYPYYKLLGTSDDDDEVSEIFYLDGAWRIGDSGGALAYLSSTAAAFPWLGTFVLGDTGTAPAPTLTPVTQAELDAGVTVAGAGDDVNGVFTPRGATNDTPVTFFYNRLQDASAQGANRSLYRNSHDWNIQNAMSGAAYTGENRTAFPWQTIWDAIDGTPPAPTVTRNDVAAEANWENV